MHKTDFHVTHWGASLLTVVLRKASDCKVVIQNNCLLYALC